MTQPATPPNVFQQPIPNPVETKEEFAPVLESGQNLICKMKPAHFDAFVRVLSVLDEKNVVVINNSFICQSVCGGTATLSANIQPILESATPLDLQILSPKKHIKLFKLIKGNSNVFIIDDPTNGRFIVRNKEISILLPKQLEKFENETQLPNLEGAIALGETLVIDKDSRSSISSLSSEANHIDLLLFIDPVTQKKQLKAVYVPNTAISIFQKFSDEKGRLDDTTAALRLRSYSFLKIPGEEYKVSIGELNGTYWMITEINTGFISVNAIESISPVNDENLLI